MKNENGSGSVYKLKGKRRKPWVARVTIGYSLDGKQLRKTLGTFETKREAQEHLLQYNKNPLLFNKITFGEVRDMWWKEQKIKLKKRSIVNYESQMKKLKDLENLPIADINLLTLQNVCQQNNAVNTTKALLNLIFDYALKYDFISVNKCKFIELKKVKKTIERKIFTQEEIEKLFERISTTKNSEQKTVASTLILIYTGLRVGELISLKNDDVDLINKVLYIQESKTKSGKRQVPISSKIIDLFDILERDKECLYKRGYTTIYLLFNKYIKNHTIHDTRHTFASLLNNADANKTSIIKLIGHSNFSTTENIYTHKDLEELRKAVELIQ